MPPNLASDISFCRVGDRLVFLDIAADRYFCLSRTAEAEFLRESAHSIHAENAPENSGDSPVLSKRFDGRTMSVCVAPPHAQSSLLDRSLPAPGFPAVAGALCDLAAARASLRIFGLRGALARIRREKAGLEGNPDIDDPMHLRRTTAAFAAAGSIVGALDNCLSQSIAVATRLLRRSVPVNLIIGVRLGPFNAHCWVQYKDWLVNDWIDMVRMFTPILVI